jgi:hypothetical protein
MPAPVNLPRNGMNRGTFLSAKWCPELSRYRWMRPAATGCNGRYRTLPLALNFQVLNPAALLDVAHLQQRRFFTAQPVIKKNSQYGPVAQFFEGGFIRRLKQGFGLVITQCWRLAFVAFYLGSFHPCTGCRRRSRCFPGGDQKCLPAPPICAGSWRPPNRDARVGRARRAHAIGSPREIHRPKPNRQNRTSLPGHVGRRDDY